jgi:hypothetical protein
MNKQKDNRDENARTNNKDPIYYNLTLNNGFTGQDETGLNTPANFTESNNQPFLKDSGDWYVSIMRCSIPSGSIPRYIFPIQNGSNNDINLSYNIFTFRYATAPNTYLDPSLISNYRATVEFQSELINPAPNTGAPYYIPTKPYVSIPKPPSANNGQQDVSGSYYFIYNIESLVNMFNNTLANLWDLYRTAMNSQYAISLPANIQPYYTYDPSTRLWSFNAESVYFGQYDNFGNAKYPRIEVTTDVLTNTNTAVPVRYNVNGGILNSCYNRYNNSIPQTINTVDYIFYQMIADQSSIESLSGFQKIIFEVSGDIIVKKSETDAIPINFQSQTQTSYEKPLIPMLVDLEVDRTQWAYNTTFIQFQASSIEQVRLISLANKSFVQNFGLNIYWVDNYGNRRPLEINSIGLPLTAKLAFFNKDF